jgi:uncharacterized protein involved in response to NO
MSTAIQTPVSAAELPIILTVAREKGLSRLVAAYAVTGLLFMLVPGTLLGAINLIGISQGQAASFTPAWMQAHGHAQIFGWIGSFILGMGFYSIPRATHAGRFAVSRGWWCWGLWTLGVSLRWASGLPAVPWRVTLPLGSMLELTAFAIFLFTVSGHKPTTPGKKLDQWIYVVMAGTVGFAVLLISNLIFAVSLAISGHSAAIPPITNSRMLTLATWGFLVPFIWGFSARWLPVFLGLAQVNARWLTAAVLLNTLGVLLHALGWTEASMGILLLGTAWAVASLHLFVRPERAAKTLGVHKSFPVFVRMAYGWLVIAAVISVAAAFVDHHHGWWGAGRHALTVGFVSTMVFAIGQRVLPAFAGMKLLFSTRLMFTCLLLLSIGCALRVTGQILAYEGIAAIGWKLLPVSALIEMTAVSAFAVNMAATFLSKAPHHINAGYSTPGFVTRPK